jgi:hypothetical protein
VNCGYGPLMTQVFDTPHAQYLQGQRRGLLATVAPNGVPQNKPVGFRYNAELGTIDIAGTDMERSAKFRNVAVHPQLHSADLAADEAPGGDTRPGIGMTGGAAERAQAAVERQVDERGEPIPSLAGEARFSEMALYVLVRRKGVWWLAAGHNTVVVADRGEVTQDGAS